MSRRGRLGILLWIAGRSRRFSRVRMPVLWNRAAPSCAAAPSIVCSCTISCIAAHCDVGHRGLEGLDPGSRAAFLCAASPRCAIPHTFLPHGIDSESRPSFVNVCASVGPRVGADIYKGFETPMEPTSTSSVSQTSALSNTRLTEQRFAEVG